ncbi:MAG TPA: pantoate--beta-alanine ligase [Solirubrobacteraceae bacterium]|jgi:pantoate--beta-alanine ligase|nr:pantoate--beta-alanine ligase [Solirubrobacteraceae bacterium]
MRTVRTVTELRSALAPARRDGLTIGLAPTMGALHDGHLALIRRAREQCDVVVVSVFVNPAQFNERSDLERYPRQQSDDEALAAAAGADLLFAPSVDEVYPPGFATTVEVIGITDRLEGAARGSGHFRGVTTVVTKLLCMAMPDIAYFGQKDAQQTIVVRRLVDDLNLPVRIEVCPTVREADGLAMSSRNSLLDPPQRSRAHGLFDALETARGLAACGERSSEVLIDAALRAMRSSGVDPEYVALVDPETLEPVAELAGEALLALAARVGDVRLIDNTILEPARASKSSQQPLQGEAIATCNA